MRCAQSRIIVTMSFLGAIKKPAQEAGALIGAGKETLTPGLILGKDAL